MEIKLSVLFFCFIALPGVATQCPSGGKVSLTSGMQLTSLHKDNCLKSEFIYLYLFKCIELKSILFSEQCVAQAECGKYQDDLKKLGAEL